jgi:hypothetical protein
MAATRTRDQKRADYLLQLYAELDQLKVEREWLKEKIANSPNVVADTRKADIFSTLKTAGKIALPGAISETERAKKAVDQSIRDLATVEDNIVAVGEIIQELELAEQADVEAHIDREVAAAKKRFLAALKAFCEALGPLHELWVPLVESGNQLEEIRWSPEAIGTKGQGHAEWLRSTAQHPLQPLPLDFAAMVANALEAALDPDHVYRDGQVKFDYEGLLVKHTPDLQESPVIEVRQSATIETRQATQEPPGLVRSRPGSLPGANFGEPARSPLDRGERPNWLQMPVPPVKSAIP